MAKSGGQRKKILHDVKKFIDEKSRGDAIGVLSDYLNNTKTKDNQQFLNDLITSVPKISSLLNVLKNLSTNASPYEKRETVSIFYKAGFSFNDVKGLGIPLTCSSWNTAIAFANTNSTKVNEKRGRKAICDEIKESIESHALSREM